MCQWCLLQLSIRFLRIWPRFLYYCILWWPMYLKLQCIGRLWSIRCCGKSYMSTERLLQSVRLLRYYRGVLRLWMPIVLQSSCARVLWRQPSDGTTQTYWLL
ncbi:hypothetical protein GALMADRAFT_1218943 [Galerina marginata CBS 339.88]|uniref:Uncharacterized protein n=1 Tax=Galerina marginata (strain CBS 339.88) TaxID=685588 RepID=A0A067SDD5_GALM3|nr:hypothetical protein GALMADRAFT_1218943 [Galerina marginata CBS 339.88]